MRNNDLLGFGKAGRGAATLGGHVGGQKDPIVATNDSQNSQSIAAAGL
jgi:hypothetical protein